MQEGWYLSRNDRPIGPLTLEALVQVYLRGEVSPASPVWSPTDRRWLQIEDSHDLQLAIAEEWARSRRPAGAVPLRVLPPPPGQPWFLPLSPLAVGLLYFATFGLYGVLWRYRHRVWALRRAGLPTSPIGLVYRYHFGLETELARAAVQAGVPRSFDLGLPSQNVVQDSVIEALLLNCCAPLMLLLLPLGLGLNAQGDASVQKTANRVNSAVTQGLPRPSVGWAEVAVLAVVSAVWLGVLAWVRATLIG